MIGESLVIRARASMDMQNYEMEVAARLEEKVLSQLYEYSKQRRFVELAERTGLSIRLLEVMDEIIYSDEEIRNRAMTLMAERRLKGGE